MSCGDILCAIRTSGAITHFPVAGLVFYRGHYLLNYIPRQATYVMRPAEGRGTIIGGLLAKGTARGLHGTCITTLITWFHKFPQDPSPKNDLS